MKLKKLKSTIIPHIEGVDLSENYLALFTGQRAVVLNRNLEIIHDIRKLSYVYDGKISPDEKSLLLTGTGNNLFLYSLENSEIYDKATLRKPYNGNLDGRGIWSNDGSKVYVLAQNSETITNIIRVYNSKNLKEFEEINVGEYILYDICRDEKTGQYYVLAYERQGSYYIIPFEALTEKRCEFSKQNDMIFSKIKFDPITDLFEINSWSRIFYVDRSSNVLPSPTLPPENVIKENLKYIVDEKLNTESVYDLLKAKGIIEKLVCDGLNKITLSKNEKYIFVVSNMEILVISAETKNILCEGKIDLDVSGFQEFEDETLVIVSREELLLYKLVE